MNIKNYRDQPYNELPALPPSHESVMTLPILGALWSAAAELAELKGKGELIPNQDILLRAITLQEARSSSEIESIYTTDDELFGNPETVDPHAKEVKQYQEALEYGYDHVNRRGVMTTNLFQELVEIITGDHIGVRPDGVDVKIGNALAGAIYTPPTGKNVIHEKLVNLQEFIHGENEELSRIPPLVKMAIIHYQFEAIHPFRDGNGRTGRIINILYLIQEGLLERPILYLSRYINHNKASYYSALQKVTEEGDWENWIIFMLKCVEEMSIYTKVKINEIHLAMKEIQEELESKLPTMKNHSKITELIFASPYSTIDGFVKEGIGTRKTCSKYLESMVDKGILKDVKQGRFKSFRNIRFMEILTG